MQHAVSMAVTPQAHLKGLIAKGVELERLPVPTNCPPVILQGVVCLAPQQCQGCGVRHCLPVQVHGACTLHSEPCGAAGLLHLGLSSCSVACSQTALDSPAAISIKQAGGSTENLLNRGKGTCCNSQLSGEQGRSAAGMLLRLHLQ